MGFNFTTSGAILNKAGKNVSATVAASQTIIQQFNDDAEAFVNTATRYDWTAASAAITASHPSFRPIIGDIVGNLAAIEVIRYDMGAVGRLEASSRINVLHDRALDGLEILKKMKRPEVEF